MFVILLFLLLLPFLVINLNRVDFIRLPSENVMNMVVYISITLSFISIIYFSYISVLVLTSQNLLNFRHELVSNGHPFIIPGLVNTISGVAATFYTVPVFLFYLLLGAVSKRNILLLLFISTFSYPLFVLSYFGRDGVVFWCLSHISAYLIFKKTYPPSLRSKIKIVLYLFFLILSVFFLFISFVRFDGVNGTFLSIISYLGQAPINFIDIASFDFTITYGSRGFNMIYSLFSEHDYSNQFIYQLGAYIEKSWVFGTILKNLLIDFGFLGSFLLLLVIAVIFIFVFLSNVMIMKLSNLFLIFAYSQIIIQGMFYFRQYNDVGNFYIMCLFLLPVFLLVMPFDRMYSLQEEN
ncbi:hypothetical protein AB4481_09930 [Vibrio breoganii]